MQFIGAVKLLSLFGIILFFGFSPSLKSQESKHFFYDNNKVKYNLLKFNNVPDTNENRLGKSKIKKINAGGLFVSPTLGGSYPLGTFGNYSKSGFLYGAKFELAYSRLYPFIFGFVYEYQKNPGSADFTTVNFLTQFDTKITYLGGSLDIILNKFLKSNFTTPIFSVEVKYAKVNREINPSGGVPEISRQESLLTYSAGIGFTIYVIDLCSKYTFAKDYSNLTVQARFHFPIIKF